MLASSRQFTVQNLDQLYVLVSSALPTKQGDTLSPTLFSIYINDLAKVLKESGIGIDVNGYKVCVLLYADDLVLLADNEKDLQTLLDLMHTWCIEWRLCINYTKSNIVHFRGSRKKRSNFSFIMVTLL